MIALAHHFFLLPTRNVTSITCRDSPGIPNHFGDSIMSDELELGHSPHLHTNPCNGHLPKAVVFTHYGINPDKFATPQGRNSWLIETSKVFDSYVSSKAVGLIFIYISRGLEQAVARRNSGTLQMDDLEGEERIRNLILMALDMSAARQGSSAGTNAPKVVVVGVPELSSLLNKLMKNERELLENLYGKTNATGPEVFTYDAPKFVEAVIRIARGEDDHCSRHPILRIDADVAIDDDAVRQIVEQVQIHHAQSPNRYYFFSGCYRGSQANEPENEHAVRVHWLYNETTGTIRPEADVFLRDIQEIGARQIDPLQKSPSMPCAKLIDQRNKREKARPAAQVISGAGLVMSLQAIKRLPPDMNATHMIVWIDDYLRRALHEAIYDIAESEIERVITAKFEQIRHPDGILPKDIEFAKNRYFDRLLRGCLMDAAIKQTDGRPGPVAKCVTDVIDRGLTKFDSPGREVQLSNDIKDAVGIRFDEVMSIWRDADYGNDILSEWARANDIPTKRDEYCAETSDDAIAYVKLVMDWRIYVNAIERLEPYDAYWVFYRIL